MESSLLNDGLCPSANVVGSSVLVVGRAEGFLCLLYPSNVVGTVVGDAEDGSGVGALVTPPLETVGW